MQKTSIRFFENIPVRAVWGELFTYCKQLKLKARDGKYYNTGVIDETGLNTVIALYRAY